MKRIRSMRNRMSKHRAGSIPGWIQQNLRERDSLFHLLFENNHVAMIVVDPEDGRIVDANPAACAFYGWDRGQFQSKTVQGMGVLRSQELMSAFSHASWGGKAPYRANHRNSAGVYKEVFLSFGPIHIASRTLVYAIVTTHGRVADPISIPRPQD